MKEETRVPEIQERLKQNAYFINPHSDANVREDIEYLLKRVELLEKKNQLLSDHVSDLTQEMENVKADFGNHR